MPVDTRDTHEVLNQAPPIVPYNVFDGDPALREALDREGGGWGVDRCRELGATAGPEEALEHAERCERNAPRLLTRDRYGRHIDRVDPSWRWLLRRSVENELHDPGGHDLRGDPNPAHHPGLAAEWGPRLMDPSYENGALAGICVTEKQGGPAGQRQVRRACGRRRLRDHRAQAVLLLPVLRSFLDARPDDERPVLLFDPRRSWFPSAEAQGQARHSFSALFQG